MKEVEIYSLSDPDSLEVKYIGKANDSILRLKSHIRDSRRRSTPISLWIRELVRSGKEPIVTVIKKVSELEWQKHEVQEIASRRGLLNIAKGGNEPACSSEVRGLNGRSNARSIHDNPKKKKIWRLRQKLGITLKWMRQNGREEKALQIETRLKIAGMF